MSLSHILIEWESSGLEYIAVADMMELVAKLQREIDKRLSENDCTQS